MKLQQGLRGERRTRPPFFMPRTAVDSAGGGLGPLWPENAALPPPPSAFFAFLCPTGLPAMNPNGCKSPLVTARLGTADKVSKLSAGTAVGCSDTDLRRSTDAPLACVNGGYLHLMHW